MYQEYFGLTQPPFKITPNTEFFFPGGNRGAILDALLYAISHGEGIIKVSGEVGSGKTMLCRMLQTCLPQQIESVYLANPSVSPDEILHAIAFELQLRIGDNEPRIKVMQELHSYLLERHTQNRQVVIFVEESQSMPLATLEEIRLLSNLETGSHKLLQIVLFGQPEIDEILRQPKIRQLRERITYSFSLTPLNSEQIKEYLMFRMRAAGYRGPDLFTQSVVHMIAKASEGLTRRVNLLADKTLLAAFADNTHTIKSKHVKAAIHDSEFSNDLGQRRKAFSRLGWLIFGIAVGTLSYSAYLLLLPMLEMPTTHQSAARDAAVASARAKRAESEKPRTTAPQPIRNDSPITQPSAADGLASESNKEALSTSPQAVSRASENANPQNTDTGELSLPLRMSAAVSSAPISTETKSSIAPQPASGYGAFEQYPILQMRIEATREAFRQAAPDDLSIQLFLTEEMRPKRIEDFLNRAPKLVNLNEIYVHPVKIGGKPRFRVFYGIYSSQQSARAAMDQLPPKYGQAFHLKLLKVGQFQN
ncbi:MAG TPA: AAA family ATPase [Burkholderiales bacterium]|nr:AAA family ATPase [Burkholderiales bacterium]